MYPSRQKSDHYATGPSTGLPDSGRLPNTLIFNLVHYVNLVMVLGSYFLYVSDILLTINFLNIFWITILSISLEIVHSYSVAVLSTLELHLTLVITHEYYVK